MDIIFVPPIKTNSLVCVYKTVFCASGGTKCIGGYCVFLEATEGFVYQVVDVFPRCIQIMNGKCDQMRPKLQERDQM